MGFADTDVAEFFYKKQPSVEELVNYLCHDLSEACSVKTPLVPKVIYLISHTLRILTALAGLCSLSFG
jgi:hypothetical protein